MAVSQMAKNQVIARVISQKGSCVACHHLGQEIILEDTTSKDMCSWAFHGIFPFYCVLKYGGSFPWEKDHNICTIACPDPDNPVVFELRRIPLK